MCSIGHPDKLRRYPDSARSFRPSLPADGASQDIIDIQFLADLPDALIGVLVPDRARPADDAKATDPGQPGRDLIGQAVGEILVLRRPQILERQNRDHLPLCPRDRASLAEDQPARRDNAPQSERAQERQASSPPGQKATPPSRFQAGGSGICLHDLRLGFGNRSGQLHLAHEGRRHDERQTE